MADGQKSASSNPEFVPAVTSVVEFAPEQRVTHTLVGLIDAKWQADDVGQIFKAELWGYFSHSGSVESFAFDKDFVYPG